MNWKPLAVGLVGGVCLFLFLASIWHDMHQEDVIIMLEEIVVTHDNL